MTFNELISNIIPHVNDASELPFIIRRDNGQWSIDYLDLTKDKAAAYLAEVKTQDPCAVMFTGADFSRGSFPMVYDDVFRARMWGEYHAAVTNGANDGELQHLADFVEEHIGSFSSEALEYLTTLDKPLDKINKLSMYSITDWNDEGAEKLNAIIEEAAQDAERARIAQEARDAAASVKEKHNIDGYIELNSIQLAGRIAILAENTDAAEPYMVAECRWDNPFHAYEYYNAAVTADYLEAVGDYVLRQSALLTQLETERSVSGLPFQTLTAADCIPHALDGNITGKVIVIKPESLTHEYRTASHQLKICTGGNGTRPDARGSAVFCTDLYSGKDSRFERWDVAGVIDPSKMPVWAEQKLYEQQGKNDPATAKEPQQHERKSSILGALNVNKDIVAKNDAARAGQVDKSAVKKKDTAIE